MGKRRLKERRTIIVRLYTLLGILLVSVLFGGGAYGVWRPEVRIDSVAISGAQVLLPHMIGEKVEEVLSGARFYIFPKDSIFLVSEEEIEKTLKDTFPRIHSASVAQTSFTSIDVSIAERVAEFAWCTEATSTPCMAADNEGFIFAQVDQELTPVYGLLADDGPALRNTIFEEGAVSKVNSLRKALETLGQETKSISFRNPDEVVLELVSGPRLEYVLGEEAQIAEAFPSVLEGIENLEEVLYIDMRFGKRVYIKRNE